MTQRKCCAKHLSSNSQCFPGLHPIGHCVGNEGRRVFRLLCTFVSIGFCSCFQKLKTSLSSLSTPILTSYKFTQHLDSSRQIIRSLNLYIGWGRHTSAPLPFKSLCTRPNVCFLNRDFPIPYYRGRSLLKHMVIPSYPFAEFPNMGKKLTWSLSHFP